MQRLAQEAKDSFEQQDGLIVYKWNGNDNFMTTIW